MSELRADARARLQQLARLNATIDELRSEADEVKQQLRTLGAGTFTLDGHKALRITETRVFDVDAAAQTLPEEHRLACLTVAYDAARVRAHLTPAQVEGFMKVNGLPRVTVL